MRTSILIAAMLIAHALKAPELSEYTSMLLWALFGFYLVADVWDFVKDVHDQNRV